MKPERAFAPEKLLVAKPAQFDGVIGYAIFLDVDLWLWGNTKGRRSRSDHRFICGLVPAGATPVPVPLSEAPPDEYFDSITDHVARALGWLKSHPEDARVAKVDPPIDRLCYRQQRVWEAVRDTADESSQILVSKTVQVWRNVNELEREHLDEPWMRKERTIEEALDRRDAWIAEHCDDEDEDLEAGAAE